MYTKDKKGTDPFAFRQGDELKDFSINQFWANLSSVASSHKFDERAVLSMLEHKVNTVIMFTKEGHDNKEEPVAKNYLSEVNKHASENVNIEAPLVHILSGLNENNGL